MKSSPILLLTLLPCLLSAPDASALVPTPVDYQAEVQPIFTRTCAIPGCHAQVNSGVRLIDYNAVTTSVGSLYRELIITPGNAAASPLFDKISRSSPRFGSRMPFGGPPLSDVEIETIRRWIDEGALPEPRSPVDYDAEIQPLFTRRCAIPACHDQPTNGVRLTDYDAALASVGLQYDRPVIVPGDAAASPLFDKISQPSPMFGGRMPLGAPPLLGAEIELIARWIDEGARPTRNLRRGDFDQNETVNISDAVLVLNFLFVGGASPVCNPLVDTNADGSVNLSDAVFLLSFLFASGPPPAPLSDAEKQSCP